MSIDEEYTNWARGQQLQARAGHIGSLSKVHLDLFHELWKIMAISHGMFSVNVHVRVADNKHDINVIKAIVLDRNEDKVREAMRMIGITKVRIRTNHYNTTWYSDPYRFVFENIRNLDYDWIREPSWLEIESIQERGIHDETIIEITTEMDTQIREALRRGDPVRSVLRRMLPQATAEQAEEMYSRYQSAFPSVQRQAGQVNREQILQNLAANARVLAETGASAQDIRELIQNIRSAGLTVVEFQNQYLGQLIPGARRP